MLVGVYQLRVLLVNSVLFELHFEELVERHVVRNHRSLADARVEESELVVSLYKAELGLDERCFFASGEAHDSVTQMQLAVFNHWLCVVADEPCYHVDEDVINLVYENNFVLLWRQYGRGKIDL